MIKKNPRVLKNLISNSFITKTSVVTILMVVLAINGFATAWTTSIAGNINTLSNWTNGSTAPTTFLTPGDTWTVTLNMTVPAGIVWALGAPASAPDTLFISTGVTVGSTGAGSAVVLNIHGSVIVNGGNFVVSGASTTQTANIDNGFLLSSGTINSNGASSVFNITTSGLDSISGGSFESTGAGTTVRLKNTGNFSISGGSLNASSTVIMTINGNFLQTGGTFGGGGTLKDTINGNSLITAGTCGGGGGITMNTFGNSTITGGTFTSNGAGGTFAMNTFGNFVITGGSFISAGAGSAVVNNIYGNCSYSGPCSMTSTGAGTTSTVHLALAASLGTMLADNTSTGTWSGTNVYVDAGCTAKLDGNFSTSAGSGTFGVIVNGTLICPVAYLVNGTGIFTVSNAATLEVANSAGINGAITSTGVKTFSTSANYEFNGTVAQVTGSYLPAALVSPDTITINNSTGVTLSQTTSTTGLLLFTSGILNTGAFTMSVPGAATDVVGAGATSYVNGTLIKTITGFTSVNYEVGDLDYAPMQLTLSTAGTAGSLGLKATNGLHPSVATSGLSTSNMANHYWTITNTGAAGPATVIPKATYNLTDIIGGTNTSFVTQEYNGTAWLGTSLATINTATPYTSTTGAGITLGSLAGAYIFGNLSCGTLPITGTGTLCSGSTTPLHDATTGGTWTSGTTTIATVSATGVVTGVSSGTSIITYTVGTCSVTTIVTVSTAPSAGTITGSANVCVGYTDAMTDAAPGGVWTSSAPATGSVSATGVVTGIAAGTTKISYTITNACGTATATMNVTVHSIANCALGNGNVSIQAPTPELAVFPNPNSGTFTVNFSSGEEETVQVVITNILGQKASEFQTVSNKLTEISLKTPPGLYLLTATGLNNSFNARVLIQ